MPLNNPGVNGTVRITGNEGTLLHNGAGPGAAWTDKNVSSTFGTRRVIILAHLRKNSATAGNAQFRCNGAADIATGINSPISYVSAAAENGGAYALIQTDSNGIFEWYTDDADNWIIWAEAWWYES